MKPAGSVTTAEVMFRSLEANYEQLSFAGARLRCFRQGGALNALKEVRTIAPARVTAGGGALSAACFITGCGDRLIDAFSERVRRHDRNVVLDAVLDGRNLTPSASAPASNDDAGSLARRSRSKAKISPRNVHTALGPPT